MATDCLFDLGMFGAETLTTCHILFFIQHYLFYTNAHASIPEMWGGFEEEIESENKSSAYTFACQGTFFHNAHATGWILAWKFKNIYIYIVYVGCVQMRKRLFMWVHTCILMGEVRRFFYDSKEWTPMKIKSIVNALANALMRVAKLYILFSVLHSAQEKLWRYVVSVVVYRTLLRGNRKQD